MYSKILVYWDLMFRKAVKDTTTHNYISNCFPKFCWTNHRMSLFQGYVVQCYNCVPEGSKLLQMTESIEWMLFIQSLHVFAWVLTSFGMRPVHCLLALPILA